MDPTPSDALHIAVSGHRFIPDAHSLRRSIRQVLRSILEDHPGKEVYLYSALAEGSDQLVASIAQEFGSINLCVPLPMTVDKYIEHFSSQDARACFQALLATAVEIIPLTPSSTEQDAYEQLGKYLVQQGDILITLWNGVYNNKPGGTSEVIRGVLAAKKPVYWLYCPDKAVDADDSLVERKQIGELEILNQQGVNPHGYPGGREE